ncbi:hypothetical protein PC122_g7909 [Phytophthora cactorum]|nr:hypothetical protein PC122_g7909 [Phytophthora cactorum]
MADQEGSSAFARRCNQQLDLDRELHRERLKFSGSRNASTCGDVGVAGSRRPTRLHRYASDCRAVPPTRCRGTGVLEPGPPESCNRTTKVYKPVADRISWPLDAQLPLIATYGTRTCAVKLPVSRWRAVIYK